MCSKLVAPGLTKRERCHENSGTLPNLPYHHPHLPCLSAVFALQNASNLTGVKRGVVEPWHPGSVCLGVERSPGACLLNRHPRQLRPAPAPHFGRRCPSAAGASQTSVCLHIAWHLVKTRIPIQAQCDPSRLTVAGHQVDLRPLAYSTGRMIMSQDSSPSSHESEKGVKSAQS